MSTKPPIRNTRRNRGVLLVLLTGARNIGLSTVWMLARGRWDDSQEPDL